MGLEENLNVPGNIRLEEHLEEQREHGIGEEHEGAG